MDRSAILLVLKELNLNENSVANIYNHGSWVYGTNSPTSDRDLIIVTRSSKQGPLKFIDDFDYFHEFELHKLWNQYDVCVYSMENFEILLQKNYLCAVQCVFLSDEFKIKEEIDFRTIYLEKYYEKFRIKQVALYEMYRDWKLYDTDNFSNHRTPSSRSIQTIQSRRDYICKNLFHGLRYLDFAEQLIQTKSIHDFKRVSHLFSEIKHRQTNPTDNSNMKRVAKFVRKTSYKFISKLDQLVPPNIINGTFEAHTIFDCTYNTTEVLEKLERICENSNYKIIFIQLNRDQQQLMVSSYYSGEYPSIIDQIRKEIYQDFKDFNILGIKIESLASDQGLPQTDIEKQIFWDHRTTYFEYRYKVLLQKNRKKELENLCRNSEYGLQLSYNAFGNLYEDKCHCIITMQLFNIGRRTARNKNEDVVRYLRNNKFSLLKVVCGFIVSNPCFEYKID